MLSETEARALVDLLLRAYPTYPADVETRALYVAALMNDRHDAAVAAAAVHSWIVNESWMPKVNELLDVIKVEAHARRVDDSERLRTAGVLPPGVLPAPRAPVAKLRIDLIRQVMSEMRLPPEQRLRMSDGERRAYEDRFVARIDELVAEHSDVLVVAEPIETYVCPMCLDTGWIEESVIEGVSTALRPCPCHPELYDRWRAGHFAPNHDCAQCAALRRGKRA